MFQKLESPQIQASWSTLRPTHQLIQEQWVQQVVEMCSTKHHKFHQGSLDTTKAITEERM